MMRPSFYYFGFAAVIPWNPVDKMILPPPRLLTCEISEQAKIGPQ
jgi:hypothetical protein